MGKYQSDPFYRAAADAAVRAVQRCSPLTGLPSDKYETWKQMELRFDPKYMLN
ncbi:MAG: energy transducer TonB, partial [Proteobacteria bacterium]|nr:energy transducer TonB [Pseudomonadota bacterium]